MELTYFIHPTTGERKTVLTPGEVDPTPELLRAIDVAVARWHWKHNIITKFNLKSIYISIETKIVVCGDTSPDELDWHEGLQYAVILTPHEPLRDMDIALGHELDSILNDFITVGVHHA